MKEGKDQKTIDQVYNKRRKTWVVRKRSVPVKPSHTGKLMQRTVDIFCGKTPPPMPIETPELPSYVAPVPKPAREAALEMYNSRF